MTNALIEMRRGLSRMGVVDEDDAESWRIITTRWPASFWLDLNDPDASLYAKAYVMASWSRQP